MAEKVISGYQKLDIQHEDTTSDASALWAHQGDDDLPDPLELKRNLRQGRIRKDYHRDKQLIVRLSSGDLRRLRRLQRRNQLSFQAWVMRMIALDEQIRPSEAKDYVRKIIPEAVAVVAERELIQAGETLMAVADRQGDWQTKKNLRGDAGVIMDAAAWFTDVRREYERLMAQTDR